MRFKLMCICAILAMAAASASAQTTYNLAGKCGKPNVQSIPAGDKDGHVFLVQQGNCEATAGDIEGAKPTSGVFAEHGEATATRSKAWGLYVQTYDSGDKVYYSYQTTATMKDGMIVSGGNKWQMTGTGKMKGIKGSGTCKLTGEADGGVNFDCTGEYTKAAAPAK